MIIEKKIQAKFKNNSNTSSVLNFLFPLGPMVRKRKQNNQEKNNLKLKKKNTLRYGGELTFPKNGVKSLERFTEKTHFTDRQRQTNGWATDGCAMTLSLLTKLSRAKDLNII